MNTSELQQLIREILSEKKKYKKKKKKRDRCLRIADRKYKKPSAYKSGAVVRCRAGEIWKDIKETSDPQSGKAAPYGSGYAVVKEIIKEIIRENLRDWFKEKWVRIDTQGNITGDCGTMKKGKATTRCLPQAKAQSLSQSERKSTVAKKIAGGKKGKQFVKNTKKAEYKK